jgi:hypothetical protein
MYGNLAHIGVRTPDSPTRTKLLYRLCYSGHVIESVLVEIMNRNRCPVCFIIKPLKFTGYCTCTLTALNFSQRMYSSVLYDSCNMEIKFPSTASASLLYSLFFHSVHPVTNMALDMSISVYILYIT